MSQAETIVGLGARTDYLAQVPNVDPARLRLTADEGMVLARVGRASRIDDIIARSGFDEARAIALLLSLRAKGAVVPARVSRPANPQVSVTAALSEDVDLPLDRKKEILDLERGLETLNHFEILGLRPGATGDEARKAYYAASKRYHPDRYYGRNLGSFRYRIDRIFRRLTEAYEALNDPEKRAAYLRANPDLNPPAPVPEPEPPPRQIDPQRAAERRDRMSRHPYLARATRLTELIQRARAQITSGEPGRALADLEVALRLDPQNKELIAMHADARRRHDALRAAEELEKGKEAELMGELATAATKYRNAATLDPTNPRAALKAAQLMRTLNMDPREVRNLAQRAVELDGKSADAHALFGAVLAEADLKKLAKKHLEDALQLDPGHAEAKKQLRKMRWPF